MTPALTVTDLQLYWTDPILLRFPLKAVNVMHAVALRTESDLVSGETPANLGQAFEVPSASSLVMLDSMLICL